MTRDQFKILHSEIMMYFQCIEFDLKRIYAGMSSEDFDDEMDAPNGEERKDLELRII